MSKSERDARRQRSRRSYQREIKALKDLLRSVEWVQPYEWK